MKLLYEDDAWRITRKGRKYPVVFIEKTNVLRYEIHLPNVPINSDYDWWIYAYNLSAMRARRIIDSPVPNISDVCRIVFNRSKFELPEIVIDELNAILMAERMASNG